MKAMKSHWLRNGLLMFAFLEDSSGDHGQMDYEAEIRGKETMAWQLKEMFSLFLTAQNNCSTNNNDKICAIFFFFLVTKKYWKVTKVWQKLEKTAIKRQTVMDEVFKLANFYLRALSPHR